MGSRLEVTLKFNGLTIATEIIMSPNNQAFNINLFQGSYMWPKFLCEVKRVFTEKNWSDLSCTFNGDFFVSPHVQIKYKRTSTIIQKVIRSTLECSIETIKGTDCSWLVEEVPTNQSPQGSSIVILKDDNCSSPSSVHAKHCQNCCHFLEDEKGDFSYVDEKETNEEFDSGQLLVESLMDTSVENV